MAESARARGARDLSAPVPAYLEPGSGSMLLQVVVIVIAAAAVGIAVYWRRHRGSKLSR